jgi:signal transduction histidine kinase
MNSNSLKLRLLLSAALGIMISLLIAGTAFFFIFQRYAEQLATRELQNDFIQLVSGIRIDEAGEIVSRAVLSDPRFEKPYGGLYWQINEEGQRPLRSRSLFDVDLPNVTQPENNVQLVSGPNAVPLFALYREIVLPLDGAKDRRLEITMAVERTDIDQAAHGFRRDMVVGLAILSIALIAGSLAQILLGLRPLVNLSSDVEAVYRGTKRRVDDSYPHEVLPLVTSLNQLLDTRETALERARQRASNMAHGLKTPLTVLHAIADQVEKAGDRKNSFAIRENTQFINEQVERQLNRARMASGHTPVIVELFQCVQRVIRTLEKMPRSDSILWQNEVEPSAVIAIDKTDLTEILGNLLDNARKWAKGKVRIRYENQVLCIEDDGPGVAAKNLEEIQERGFRLDDKNQGHGLGLSIVRDLVESYGLDIKYGRSELGGLSVSIAKIL